MPTEHCPDPSSYDIEVGDTVFLRDYGDHGRRHSDIVNKKVTVLSSDGLRGRHSKHDILRCNFGCGGSRGFFRHRYIKVQVHTWEV
jgi:hypothetical protein